MTKAIISWKGQISIPPAIRQRLHLEPGTEISIEVQDETLVMKRIVQELPDWRTMQGMFQSNESLTKALEAEHQAELDREDAKFQDR